MRSQVAVANLAGNLLAALAVACSHPSGGGEKQSHPLPVAASSSVATRTSATRRIPRQLRERVAQNCERIVVAKNPCRQSAANQHRLATCGVVTHISALTSSNRST